jgi:outer membrane receptor protein involved in Fe transport
MATLLPGLLTTVANAQDTEVVRTLEEIIVTGSRIRRDTLNESAAIMDIGSEDLDQTGVTNLGDILQNLPISGSAPNSKFNVPGNVGFPQDGAGPSPFGRANSTHPASRPTGVLRASISVSRRICDDYVKPLLGPPISSSVYLLATSKEY